MVMKLNSSRRPARRWSLLLALTALFGAMAPAAVEASGAAQGGVPCPAYLSGMKPLKIGFKWTEGPAWDPKAQRWIFSDLMGETEYGITASGQLTALRQPAGYPNGHALLPDGRFVVAQHDRTLGIVNGDGSGFRVIASTYMGKKLNSPNVWLSPKTVISTSPTPPSGSRATALSRLLPISASRGCIASATATSP